jgi:transposase
VVDNFSGHDKGVEILREAGVEIVPHPSNSPALNPIENMIGMCKDIYRQDSTCWDNTKEACLKKHQEIWRKFPLDKFRSSVESMPRRLQEVIDAEGGYTKTHW